MLLLKSEAELETNRPDTIIGKAHKQAIVTLTERKSRLHSFCGNTLNNRLRKRVGFKTHNQVFFGVKSNVTLTT